jgi:hypothetical protein
MSGPVEARDGVAIMVVGDTLVGLWKSPASPERWRFQLNRMERVAERYGSVVCLDLILQGSTPPDSALRAEMQADFKRLSGKLRRFVVVPLGDSLWLAVVRAIVRGVLLLSGQSGRQRVASTIAEGIDEVLVGAGPQTASKEELETAVSAAFAALGVERADAA